MDISQFTSVSCETILHQPMPSTAGVCRQTKTTLQAHKRKPYTKTPKPTPGYTEQTLPPRDTVRDNGRAQTRASESGGQKSRDDTVADKDVGEDEVPGPELIAKPPGENGRPGRGGYSVANRVRYTADEWAEIEVRVFAFSLEAID